MPKKENDLNYDKWFSINDLFKSVNNGVKTDRDSLFISESKLKLENRFKILLSDNIPQSFINEFRVIDSGSFKITERIKLKKFNTEYIKPILYRPFDIRYIYYDPKIVSRPAQKVMQHMLKENVALLSCRQQSTFHFQHILVSKILSEVCTVSLQTKETTYAFPLYIYTESNGQQTIEKQKERTPNLNTEIVNQIANKLRLIFIDEKDTTESSFAPIDILDYIYAVLHSPTYREKYKEFLKIDFPRVPYPKATNTFWQLVKLGGELRQIHLLESPIVNKFITKYPKDGDNIVTKVTFDTYCYEPTLPGEEYPDYLGAVKINDEQFFADVPTSAWEFYIGGYQPAQKWLKDRKGRKLEFDDILHYQKIIVALTETARLMKEIDAIEIE